MKHLKPILLFTILLLACTAVNAGKQTERPRIEFDSLSYDFGTIGAEDGTVSHVFTFTNTGKKPLIIISATASCGCTRPQYTTDPVKPGKKGHITVTFRPAGQPIGEFNKTIRVRSNAVGRREALTITGVIVPGTKKHK